MTILAKIDVSKIDKARLYKGAKGTYLDLVIVEKRSDYGDDFMICQSVSKDERQKGIKGAILGNGKYARSSAPASTQPISGPDQSGAADHGAFGEVPF